MKIKVLRTRIVWINVIQVKTLIGRMYTLDGITNDYTVDDLKELLTKQIHVPK